MKKIIYTKTIELLVIDGIMLAFLTFKERLTWDWILIYSGWLIFFHPVLLTYLSNQLCDHFSQLYSQIRPRFWRFALQILLWDSLIILSLICLSRIPLFLQGTLLILGHLIPSYRISQSLKQDFPKAYQEQISFWSILWKMRKTKPVELGLFYLFLVSRMMVTGPSLTSSTCISAPKMPVWTGTSCAHFWLNAS